MSNLDILLFDDQLSEEELIIKSSAKDYCQSELMPRILEANRKEVFDKSVYKEMGKLGFLGAPINGYGCAGTNYVSYGLIARELRELIQVIDQHLVFKLRLQCMLYINLDQKSRKIFIYLKWLKEV